MRESFGPESEFTRADPVSLAELHQVLTLLSVPDEELVQSDIPDDHVTVEAIAEATGLSMKEVEEALEEVRRLDTEEELSRRIRELEEPLHRVERPGHSPGDPVTKTPSSRKELFSRLLDDQPKHGERLPRKRRLVTTPQEKISATIAYIVMLAACLALVVLSIWGVVKVLRGIP